MYMAKVIMSVDDSASIRQMVSFTLSDAGYQVLEAIDGKDALTKLGTATVDMLITDLNMPNMDGIELIKNVRAQAKHKFIPNIMLTTESQDSKKQQGKAAGASGWIVKPFSATQLVDVVKKLIK
jgi:two-component system chemotaxis response regulator CheY